MNSTPRFDRSRMTAIVCLMAFALQNSSGCSKNPTSFPSTIQQSESSSDAGQNTDQVGSDHAAMESQPTPDQIAAIEFVRLHKLLSEQKEKLNQIAASIREPIEKRVKEIGEQQRERLRGDIKELEEQRQIDYIRLKGSGTRDAQTLFLLTDGELKRKKELLVAVDAMEETAISDAVNDGLNSNYKAEIELFQQLQSEFNEHLRVNAEIFKKNLPGKDTAD